MLGRPAFGYPQMVERANVDNVESAEMRMFLGAKMRICLQFCSEYAKIGRREKRENREKRNEEN